MQKISLKATIKYLIVPIITITSGFLGAFAEPHIRHNIIGIPFSYIMAAMVLSVCIIIIIAIQFNKIAPIIEKFRIVVMLAIFFIISGIFAIIYGMTFNRAVDPLYSNFISKQDIESMGGHVGQNYDAIHYILNVPFSYSSAFIGLIIGMLLAAWIISIFFPDSFEFF